MKIRLIRFVSVLLLVSIVVLSYIDIHDVFTDKSMSTLNMILFILYAGKICAVVRYNPSCELRTGMCGFRTLALQKALNQNGAGILEDGEFGKMTQNAVLAYQKAQGLPQTGIADAEVSQQLHLIEADSEEQPQRKAGQYIRVVGNSVNLRTGPRTEYDSAGVAHKGDLLPKVDTHGWTAVAGDGHPYWISDRYIVLQESCDSAI